MRVALIAAVLVSGCAADGGRIREFESVQAAAKTVCEVMADPDSLVGRRIVVEGIYFATPHERLLVGRGCGQWSLRVSQSLDLDGDPRAEAVVDRFRRKHPTVRIPVVYSGIVTAHSVIHDCAEPRCRTYSLEESRLLAAFPRIALPLGG
ncbi:MAG TPA: hypothetical protein VFQ67_03605 [Allosphingosinicella sp.]|jgi:hypothetical protein|nr:hypothetical protein [Allosphingosinicella sp.]